MTVSTSRKSSRKAPLSALGTIYPPFIVPGAAARPRGEARPGLAEGRRAGPGQDLRQGRIRTGDERGLRLGRGCTGPRTSVHSRPQSRVPTPAPRKMAAVLLRFATLRLPPSTLALANEHRGRVGPARSQFVRTICGAGAEPEL